jgi:hypothetical protein
MAEKKSEIKVTDRRLFTAEGELRPEAPDEEQVAAIEGPEQVETSTPQPPRTARMDVAEQSQPGAGRDLPPPPSDAEQQAGRDAFRDAGVKVDDALREALGPEHKPDAMQVTFENFIASLYMSAMFQLGLLHEQGQQPQVDIVGARHTIDTISMLEEKTRGNLSDDEKAVVQDVLFRLRMAFVEMTNALTRAPAPGAPPNRK